MICHECGGLLHIGLGRHVCLDPEPERLRRRTEQMRQMQQGAEDAARLLRGFEAVMNQAGARMADALRGPIRVSATVGAAIDCRLGEECWAHGCEQRPHRQIESAT